MGEPDSILQDFILKNLQSHVTPSDLERRPALVLEDSKIAIDLVVELCKLLVTESLDKINYRQSQNLHQRHQKHPSQYNPPGISRTYTGYHSGTRATTATSC
ncbi:hypothetical protein Pelo_6520 [Pelomyxa schiedti]|nr:hypothetical protein Pelo_6520 [Pelomyxa schiedti]